MHKHHWKYARSLMLKNMYKIAQQPNPQHTVEDKPNYGEGLFLKQ